MESSPFTTEVVDSSSSLLSLLDNLAAIPPPSTSIPALYVDLEGSLLSRNGSVSLVTICALPGTTVYLADIHQLGKAAFETTNAAKVSLKSALESPSIQKVFFDVRNDSDALFAHFQITLDGVQDLQGMELAARVGSKKLFSGLAKCIENHSPISRARKKEWTRRKDEMTRQFDAHAKGQLGIFRSTAAECGHQTVLCRGCCASAGIIYRI